MPELQPAENFVIGEALDQITDEMLAGLDHDVLQKLQWSLDAGVQQLRAAQERVHDAREKQDLANRPPRSANARVIGMGGGPLPQLGPGKGK